MKRVLITGGAGYIGTRLSEALLNSGYQVTVIDNLYYAQHPPIHLAKYDNFNFIVGDVQDYKLVKEEVLKSDIIFPLACLTGAPISNRFQKLATEVNRDAILELSKMVTPGQKLIFPTTNSGYGVGSQTHECDEKSPLNPVSLYGRLKNEAEQALLDMGNCVTFRLATVFGTSHRMRMDLLVNDFTYRAFRDRCIVLYEGHFRRNYVYIGDVVECFVYAIENYESLKGQAFNLGLSTANLTKRELCSEIQKEISDLKVFEDEIAKDPDQRDYLVSNEKLKKAGFEATTSLAVGIRELIRSYQFLKMNTYSNI